MTAPIFRSRADADLTAKIYDRVPVFINEAEGRGGNPWGADFHTRIWHMAEDSHWFRTAAQLRAAGFERDGVDWVPRGLAPRQRVFNLGGERDAPALDLEGDLLRAGKRYVPLYEAKMIHQFDHRWATYDAHGENSRDATLAEKANSNFEPTPRYWVPETEVVGRLLAKGWSRSWLMGWRNITNATNERTLIVAVLPRFAVAHSMPLILLKGEPLYAAILLSNLSSLLADYCVRQKLGGTNLTFQYLFQLPTLKPSDYNAKEIEFITPRVLELTYTSHSLAPFGHDLGYEGPPFAWNEDRRALLRAELDAFYARAYGLTRDELRYILDPADVRGPDYPSETFRVLKTNEIARYGEYRTARLVLDAWDRMERGELT